MGTGVATLVGRDGVEALASASARSWWRHEYQHSGKPCSNKTSGPLPASATRIGAPLTSTTLCPMLMPAPERFASSDMTPPKLI